jgi:hypothetical protein
MATGCLPPDLRDQHASAVEAFELATDVDPEAPFVDPRQALGPPDGRTVAIGVDTFITLRFFRAIPDGPGADLRVYELGEDGARAEVAVSLDGVTFTALRPHATGLVTEYDLSAAGFDRVGYVRIRGLDRAGDEPGYDLDALEAVH